MSVSLGDQRLPVGGCWGQAWAADMDQ